MSEIRFKIDTKRLTLDDLIALDEGMFDRPRAMRDLLARFVTDEMGVFLDENAARQAVGKLNVEEIFQAAKQFSDSIKELRANAVNPPTAAA